MSDIPKRFTAAYYNGEYFVGATGGKKFMRPEGIKGSWSYYNETGDAPGCEEIAKGFKTVFNPKAMLDVGAGRGTMVAYSRKVGIEARGFDWSRWAVNEGRYSGCKSEWLIEHDGTKPLPYEDAAFDLVTALDYMEHVYIDDLPQVIDELYRVTKHYIFVEIDTVDGVREKGYILHKNKLVPIELEANAAAGHVSVQTEQFWIDLFEEKDWLIRRDLKQWFISLVPNNLIGNWIVNTILVFSKEG